MNYTSTRDASVKVSSAMAISQGISEDGGLFVPEFIPKLTDADFANGTPIVRVGKKKHYKIEVE